MFAGTNKAMQQYMRHPSRILLEGWSMAIVAETNKQNHLTINYFTNIVSYMLNFKSHFLQCFGLVTVSGMLVATLYRDRINIY